jgi:hypothetical protein
MKRVSSSIVATILLLITSASVLSCTKTHEPVDNSMVQVWKSNTLEALGVVIGDGSQVLTVVNYEEYNPGELEIVVAGQGRYSASIQAIDSRTGATLLRLEGAKLPVASTGDATTVKTNQEVFIHGLMGKELNFKRSPALVSNYPDLLPLGFNVRLTDAALRKGGWVSEQGAIVTDKKGDVLGLESIYFYRLVLTLGPPGYIPPVISINSMLELLSPDANQKPWANGPLLFFVNTKNASSGGYDGFVNDYEAAAGAIQTLLNELGKPLSTTDVLQNYLLYAWPNESSDGTLLTTVFPRPVELRDTQGNILALAKWVGIQWGRSDGKSSRILYGSVAYAVAGSFEIEGDTTNLASIIRAQFDHPYGP